jgi:propanol-preferring alcohol dehydrogenase
MRAMVLRGTAPVETSPLRLEEVPDPEPGPGQVRVRVRACGVCRTDLHVVEGDLPRLRSPVVPGHQVVGLVDAVGAGVTSPRVGERVGVAWLQGTCGRCEPCGERHENLCEAPTFTGHGVDGGYAELVVANADWTYRLSDAFSDLEATPLLCAGIIGYRALRRSGVEPGQRLGLWGFGNSAHVTIQVARHRGIEVFVCSLAEGHQQLARELGAAWVGAASEPPPVALHGAILFAPAGELVIPSLRALRPGGRLAIAGIHLSPIPPIDYDRDLFRERSITSVTANTRQDALELLEAAAAIPIRTRVAAYPLERANEALQDLEASRLRGAAALVV